MMMNLLQHLSFSQVVIEDTEDSNRYEFECDKWLADDEDDNLTTRDLECTKGKRDCHVNIICIEEVTGSNPTTATFSLLICLIKITVLMELQIW